MSKPMRIAAIYDIHGNLPALEAVLKEIRQAAVDQIVVGGDVIPGPMPSESIAALLELDVSVQFIQGNGEREVLALRSGAGPYSAPEGIRDMMQWVAQQLSAKQVQLLTNWPKRLRLHIPGLGRVLFCHATPRDDNEIFTRLTPEERLRPVFEPADASLVICGHTHMQFERSVGDVRIVNAGSVGMPFGAPGAYWLLLEPDLELRCTGYDLARAAERIRATDCPQAEEFAAGNVLQPPSEADMLKVLERGAL